MSSLSLSALDAKIESVAAGALKHIGQSLDLKKRIESLEGGAKLDLDAFRASLMGEVKDMLSALRTEIIGEVKAEASDSVGLVGKAVADLTSTPEPEAAKVEPAASVPADAPKVDSTGVIVPTL